MVSSNVKILDAVRAGGNQYSKKEIAIETGLPWGTMHKAVEALLDADILIAHKGSKPVSAGRPSVPLCINTEAAYWCGIDIGAQSTRLVFCDLNFNPFYRNCIQTEPYSNSERFLDWLSGFYIDSLSESRCDRNRIRGIGLAVSGNVDSEAGIIASGGNFGIKYGENIDLGPFQAKAGIPVFAVSTQNAAACAEYNFGRRAHCPNLVTIGLGVGIGSGVIANHQLLISHPRHPIGYIGHILIPGNNHKCTCGFTGCLEAYSGSKFLKSVAMEELPDRSALHSAAALDRAAANGDPDSIRIMNTAASYNAAGIAAMIQLYNPESLIFSGGQVRHDGYLYQRTLECLKQILPPERCSCDISITVLGEYQSAMGGARLAFERFF